MFTCICVCALSGSDREARRVPRTAPRGSVSTRSLPTTCSLLYLSMPYICAMSGSDREARVPRTAPRGSVRTDTCAYTCTVAAYGLLFRQSGRHAMCKPDAVPRLDGRQGCCVCFQRRVRHSCFVPRFRPSGRHEICKPDAVPRLDGWQCYCVCCRSESRVRSDMAYALPHITMAARADL